MLYIIRHGETEWNVEGRCQGWSESHLTQKGIAQAHLATDEVAKLPIKHIYCSDLIRARDTAEIINKTLQVKITFDKRLREFSSGTLEGTLSAQFPEEVRRERAKRITSQEICRKYGMETRQDVFDRARSFVDELRAKHSDDALIVSHGGFITILLHAIKHQKLDNKVYDDEFYIPENASIVKINLF